MTDIPLTNPNQRGLINAAEALGFDVRVILADVAAEGEDGKYPAHQDVVIVGKRERPAEGAIWAFHARWWRQGPETLIKRAGENVSTLGVALLLRELKTGIREVSASDVLLASGALFFDREPMTRSEVAAEKVEKAIERERKRAERALLSARRRSVVTD